jgi:NADH-quinone oxidoreductase subunit J
MTISFAILALLTAGAAIAAMALRNLVHCALGLVVALTGLAALFLQLDAEFVGLAQVLVYVGAVAILIVFAVLLTRGNDPARPALAAPPPWRGLFIAGAAFATMAGAVLSSIVLHRPGGVASKTEVKQIGDKLMNEYVLPLEVIGLLLTAAMIGAVIIALREKPERHTENKPTR